MTTFQKCPECAELFPKNDARCPKCQHAVAGAAPQAEEALAREYQRRRSRHLRNYCINMGLMIAFAGCCVLLLILYYHNHYGWTSDYRNPSLIWLVLTQEETQQFRSNWVIPLGLLGIMAILGVLLIFFKFLFRIELNCPACNVRLDEIGLNNGCCPGCDALLCQTPKKRPLRSLAAGLLGLLMLGALGAWLWRHSSHDAGEARSDPSIRQGPSASESRGPVRTPGDQPSHGISTKKDAPSAETKTEIPPRVLYIVGGVLGISILAQFFNLRRIFKPHYFTGRDIMDGSNDYGFRRNTPWL